MGRSTTSRLGAVLPKAAGSSSRDRGDGRLDPVRWRRPARGTLLRLVLAAILLGVAVVMSEQASTTCETGAADEAQPAAQPKASSPGHDSVRPVPPGSVGVPVRLADPAALALVEAGNRIDLLRLDESDGSTTPVAGSALVLQVTGSDDPAIGGLLLALTPEEAKQAVTRPGQSFAVQIRPG